MHVSIKGCGHLWAKFQQPAMCKRLGQISQISDKIQIAYDMFVDTC